MLNLTRRLAFLILFLPIAIPVMTWTAIVLLASVLAWMVTGTWPEGWFLADYMGWLLDLPFRLLPH